MIARLREAIEEPDATDVPSILDVPSMLSVAQVVGDVLSDVRADVAERLTKMSQLADASIIVAGQRRGGRMRLFRLYPEGNFIEATEDTPFLQLGEHKYGKPILDRVITPETSLANARKAALLSMDSTLRSNLSVGMPLDMAVIRDGALRIGSEFRVEQGDEHFAAMSEAWSIALRESFERMPDSGGTEAD